MDEAETRRVALGPFEVIEQAPGMEGADIGAVGDGLGEFVEVGAVEIDARLVVDLAIGAGRGVVGSAVLGDLDGEAVIAPDAHGDFIEAARVNLPAEIGSRAGFARRASAWRRRGWGSEVIGSGWRRGCRRD